MKLLNKFPLIFIVILFLFNYACADIDDDLGLDDIIESYSDITASRIKRRSMNINWLKISDKVREMEHLQYKVVRSLDPNIDTVDNANANGLLEMDWTTNTNTVSITNLEIDTIYYFNVLVKDDIGRTAIYNMKKVRTLDPNTPLPGNDGTMSISNISTNSITISWTEAQDENFTQADLNYRIYYSTANNIDTIENIELNGTPVGNFSNNVISLSATGLAEATTYYFNVIVSNNNGYKSVYNTISERTSDSSFPIPGDSGKLILMKVLSNSLDIVWTKASDTYTPKADIEYKVVYSASDNVSTVADAELNGIVITDWTKDIDSVSVSGLSISTTYYFNIIVKDHCENKAIYISDWRKTSDADGNYLYNHGFTNTSSMPWRGDYFPYTAGTQFHSDTDRWYIFTTASASTGFSQCYVRHLTNVRWTPGESAYAWMYVSGNIGAVGAGEVAIAYVKVAFYNEANSVPGTLFPTAITKYQTEMDNSGYTNRLYLTTPPAPSGTYSAKLWFGLYKSPTAVGIQLRMSVYDTYLGVLIP